MSGAPIDQDVPAPSAVPIPDLAILDEALRGSEDALRGVVCKLRPADLGRELSRRSKHDACRVFGALDDRHAAAMLRAAHPAVVGHVVAHAQPAQAARTLEFLSTEQQVEVLDQLEGDARTRVEAAMAPDHRAIVMRQLQYSATAVGRMMSPKIWRCIAGQSAGDAMTWLREHSADVEVAMNLYIVDAGGKLVGVCPLREVSIAASDVVIDTIMTKSPIAVVEDSERGDAAEIIRIHDFLSLPVVDRAGKLIGAVRVDDLLDAAIDRIGAGGLNQGAVASKLATRAPYFQTSILRVVRSRLTWLILLFVAETATGTVLRYFEDELAKVVALSFFVPLLIGTGGNAGSQTVSTIIRALAVTEVRVRDIARVVVREISVGILLGVLLGVIAFGRALLWGVSYDLALCVALTILVVCVWANAVGAAIPLAAQKVGIDPTVISAPLITTLVDASGLFIYFTVAHILISQLH